MATIGYYYMDFDEGVDAMRDEIIAAGHTPVQILDLSASELSGVDALYVWNGNNYEYNAEFLDQMPEITAAINGGMNMVFFDRAIGFANPSDVLPGTNLVHVRATTDNADLTDLGEATFGTGLGGSVTDTSLDGGNYTTHGYVEASSLPVGANVLMTLGGGDEANAVGFVYDFGAGTVQYYGIPLDFYTETNPAWHGFAVNTLQFAGMCLAEGTRVLTFRGYRPVEKLRAGQLIWTIENGFQPLVAVIRSEPGAEAGYLLPKGVLGNKRPLLLSAQHRVFLRGPVVELLSGRNGAFALTKHLVGIGGVKALGRSNLRFFNLAFNRHEVILAEGALVESLLVNRNTRQVMGRAARNAVAACGDMDLRYPELDAPTARAAFGALCRSMGCQGKAA